MVSQIEEWIRYIQIPRSELGNYSICPYARTAQNKYTVTECTLDTIHKLVSECNIIENKLCIFYLSNYEEYSTESLEQMTQYLNEQYLHLNKVVLDSDPRNPFSLNNVVTTFPECYIWIVQPLDDLTEKSDKLKVATNYYDYWTQEQLNEVVTWRYNYNRNDTGELT